MYHVIVCVFHPGLLLLSKGACCGLTTTPPASALTPTASATNRMAVLSIMPALAAEAGKQEAALPTARGLG
jgi:hypothetical protein